MHERNPTQTHATLVAFCLAIISFILHFTLAIQLYLNGDLSPIDYFFDADIGWYLSGFETGLNNHGSYGGRNLIHLNVDNIIHTLVWSISNIIAFFTDTADFKSIISFVAISMNPLAFAIGTGFLFLALARAGFGVFSASIATMLSIVSFSGMLFGSVPESSGFTGAAFAYVFYLVARSIQEGKLPFFPWLVAGTILFSTTATNLVPFFIILFLTYFYLETPFPIALKRSIMLCLNAITASLAILLFFALINGSYRDVLHIKGQLSQVHYPRFYDLKRIGIAYLNTVLPPQPYSLISKADSQGSRYQINRLTFREDVDQIVEELPFLSLGKYQESRIPRALDWILFLTAIILSLMAFPSLSKVPKTLMIISLCIIGYHTLFHWIFGYELFLYSQYWYVAEIMMISLGMIGPSWVGATSRLIVSVLTVVAALHTLEILHFSFVGIS